MGPEPPDSCPELRAVAAACRARKHPRCAGRQRLDPTPIL